MQNRREFLEITGKVAGGITLASLLSNNSWAGTTPTPFGIQLYTLRDIIEPNNADVIGTLKQIAKFGYKEIESYEGPNGIFWGMTAKEFKKVMDDLGMKLVSSHCDIFQNFEKKVEDAASIGMKYLVCPWLGPQKSIDDFKEFADQFNDKAAVCAKHGFRFGYHNHDYGFKPIDNQLPQEVLLNNTDAKLVDFEMDIYWVVNAGQNPIEWLKKYPNRFRLCHVKDRSKTAIEDGTYPSVNLGTGNIDFKNILKEGKKFGLNKFFVEQEAYLNETPMDAAKAGAFYMKKVGI